MQILCLYFPLKQPLELELSRLHFNRLPFVRDIPVVYRLSSKLQEPSGEQDSPELCFPGEREDTL